MATLPNPDRQQVHAQLMQRLSDMGEAVGMTKSDLRGAINAADDWLDSNMAAYNLALPLLVRNLLTARLKALILVLLILRRFEVL
jgi:hypothetical protein